MDDMSMDKMLAETITFLAMQEVINNYFNDFCNQHLSNGGTCDNCKFSFCKTEEDCKAMYLREALNTYNKGE